MNKLLAKVLLIVCLIPICFAVSLFLVGVIISQRNGMVSDPTIGHYIGLVRDDPNGFRLTALFTMMLTLLLGSALIGSDRKNYHSEMYRVTEDIEIPQRCGQGQYGNDWFMGKRKFNRLFPRVTVNPNDPVIRYLIDTGYDDLGRQSSAAKSKKELERQADTRIRISRAALPLKQGGVVVGYSKAHGKERINIVADDKHTILVGSTGESKTRSVILETLGTLMLAGESFFCTDTKAEIRQYTEPTLRKLGYRIIVLDYRDMSKSMAYNFLQNVVDKVNAGAINEAMQLSSDLAVFLAGERAGNQDPMWHDGKIAVLAAGIIACVYDNRDRPENQNLPYVYAWLTQMCSERKDGMLLIKYLDAVGDEHPANLKLAQANVAPSKTRGSFYTSAGMALSIFTDWQLAHICDHSDFKITDAAVQPTAIFMHLPDNRKTFYSLATLFVSQLYSELTDYANLVVKTGRLPIRFNMILEEFGNFSKIEDLQGKFSLARSLGIRFLLSLQDYSQMFEIYGDHIAETIKSNGGITIYLGTDNPRTNEEISKSCGNYTTSSYSESSSKDSGSNSMNLMQRLLLFPNEVKLIKRPHQLVISRDGVKVAFAPDLSKYYFNQMFGLGDKEHNMQVRLIREGSRPQLYDVSKPPDYKSALWRPENFNKFIAESAERKRRK